MTTPRNRSTTETSLCFSLGGRWERDATVVPQEKEDDALLAQELNALTLEQRNQLYDEVRMPVDVYHGLFFLVRLSSYR